MSTMWKRMGNFLGFVEDYDDEYGEAAEGTPTPSRETPSLRAEPSNVRRLPPTRVEEVHGGGTATKVRAVTGHTGHKVHLTEPTTFNDVEEVGENFRNGVPVIMNLAGASENVAKRLLDFASGLIFGLDGRIERVGDRVFLLTPAGVEVSTEERRRLTERGFFNQA
jgi:cell division inhibitor SepF